MNKEKHILVLDSTITTTDGLPLNNNLTSEDVKNKIIALDINPQIFYYEQLLDDLTFEVVQQTYDKLSDSGLCTNIRIKGKHLEWNFVYIGASLAFFSGNYLDQYVISKMSKFFL